MRFLVTGGAGFIGSAVVRYLIQQTKHEVLVFDKLTYAGNMQSLDVVSKSERFHFVKGDILDKDTIAKTLREFKPTAIMHLAAESHVDRSIDGPEVFIQTNVLGTYQMLNQARHYWQEQSEEFKKSFRFHHISTDEVFGSLGKTGLFTEATAYAPNSPYSASKAGSDHLVRAWHHTFGLPTITTNCSNNYGPYHFPEKLIPVMILNAISGKLLPVYGSGENIRDWLFVEDHAEALVTAVTRGTPGETYNIGGDSEQTNLNVVKEICRILDSVKPAKEGSYSRLINFVKDRPGHDFRYAIDASKIREELGWKPRETFESGIQKTVSWYLDNKSWWQAILDGSYRLERLGLGQ